MVSEMIWKPLGAHYDGYYQVDPSGIAFAGGGFDLNLRDMAAFGEMMRNGGRLNGRQVIPEIAVNYHPKNGCPLFFILFYLLLVQKIFRYSLISRN